MLGLFSKDNLPFLALVQRHGPLVLGGDHFPQPGMCWCQPGKCEKCNTFHIHRRFADGAAGVCEMEGFEDWDGGEEHRYLLPDETA